MPTKPRKSRTAERQSQRPAAIDENQLYPVEVGMAALDMGRATFYNHVAAGLIHVIKHGKRTKLSGAEIIRVVHGSQAAA